jgi:DNA replication protein DnaC
MDRDEAASWHTEHAMRALGVYADGEFDLDRLPSMLGPVIDWAAVQKRDPAEVATLVLQGVVGCGKTSQCFCLLRDLVLWHAQRGERYTWYFMTHRKFAAAMQPGSGRDPDALMHRLMTADLVVLDDLGDFNMQDFGRAADATSRLINHRTHHRLASVYDTNLPFVRDEGVRQAEREFGQIAVLADTLDGRALSRLQSGWTVTMPEVDYRAAQGRVFHT